MGSMGELAWIIALLFVVGVLVLTACLCLMAKIGDSYEREHQRREAERP
jgi:hypothetical protein